MEIPAQNAAEAMPVDTGKKGRLAPKRRSI